MSLFTIGDLHLSLSTEKPMDIFSGWGNYTERLYDNWTAAVKDDDTVVVVGDISWGMSLDEAERDFEFIDRLPGKKIIIKGNHDYWWVTRKKLDNWIVEKGFKTVSFLLNDSYCVQDTAVCGTRGWTLDESTPEGEKIYRRELGRLTASLESSMCFDCSERIAFLHYPPIYRSFYSEEIVGILKAYGANRCYYGHVHGESIPYSYTGEKDGIFFKLVSADNLGFTPYFIK